MASDGVGGESVYVGPADATGALENVVGPPTFPQKRKPAKKNAITTSARTTTIPSEVESDLCLAAGGGQTGALGAGPAGVVTGGTTTGATGRGIATRRRGGGGSGTPTGATGRAGGTGGTAAAGATGPGAGRGGRTGGTGGRPPAAARGVGRGGSLVAMMSLSLPGAHAPG